MKQFLSALWGIIIDILDILAAIIRFVWRTLIRIVRWLIPRAKSAGRTAQKTMKREWDALPDQINRTREKVREKTIQIRDNMPEYKNKIKQMTQQGMEAAGKASQWAKQSLSQGADTFHRNTEKFVESIERSESEAQTEAETETTTILKMEPLIGTTTHDDTEFDSEEQKAKIVTLPITQTDTKPKANPGKTGRVTAPGKRFQKKHLWVIIGIIAIIGAVSTSNKKKSSNTAPAPQPTPYPSSSGIYNSPGVTPTPSNDQLILEQMNAQTEALREQNEQMQADYQRQREEKAAEKAQEAAMDAAHKERMRQLREDQAKRRAESMSGYGLD